MASIATWLEEFNASPGRVEELFAKAEEVDPGLAVELAAYSSPASRHRHEQRFLALKFLQGAVSRRWRVPAASGRRPPLGSDEGPGLEEPAKAQILRQLLGDVGGEAVQFLAQKRAQIVAEICRFDLTRWNTVFQVLTAAAAIPPAEEQPRESRLLFCLHVVLKELSGTRIGTHVLEFTKASKALFGVLARPLEVLRREEVDESGAEVCCLAVKSMNCLLAGVSEIDPALVSLQFELAYKVLLRAPTAATSKWKSKLDKQLRKVPLIAIKTHSTWFEQQPYYASFVSCTFALLGGSSGDNQLCAFRFWTLLVSQKASLGAHELALAMQSALAGLRLTPLQVEQWKAEGGERFCNEEADNVFDTKLTGDGTLRTVAQRFLQTCVDKMNGNLDALTLTLQRETPRSELEWEAWLCALQLDPLLGARRPGEVGFRPQVLTCLSAHSSSSTPERAMLTRRALCVLQHAHPVADYYPVLFNLLASAEVEDLGVLLQAIKLYIAIISHSAQHQTFSLPVLAKYLSIPQVVVVWRRFEMVESKVRIIDLFSAIVLGASSPLLMDPASLAFVMDEFVPFALREPGLEVTRNPLICSAVLGLVQACVQCIGFSHLEPKSQHVCVDLIQRCATTHELQLLDWPVVLVACLETCTTSRPEMLLPLVLPELLARIGDVSVRCRVLECVALLSLENGDYSVAVVAPLWESVVETKPAAAAAVASTSRRSLFPRTAPDAPFILYDVCHCLGVLAHCNNLVPVAFWSGVLNSPAAGVQTGDVRDAIELVTLRCQVVLYKRAFFTELGAAREFALLCNKYFDAMGYAPKHVVWRNRLWVYVLLYIVAKCSSVQEVQCFMPSLVECCSKLVSQGHSRPMNSIAACSNPSSSSSRKPRSADTAHDLRVLAILAALDKTNFDELFKASWVRLEAKFPAPELETLKSPKLQVLLL